MLMEIEVYESQNCPLNITRMFSTLEQSKPASYVKTTGIDGKEGIFDVVGWSSTGPTEAHAVLVEDSGDGIAMLIYGNEEGIRLRPSGDTEPWSLKSPNQWGEACLLLDKDVAIK